MDHENALGEVGALARLLVEAERRVVNVDDELSKAKEHARRLREEALPGAMQELGVEELTLTDGSKITMGLEVYCSISSDNKPAAHAWLERNGFGGLIKTSISLPFGRSEEEQADLRDFLEFLNSAGLTYEQEQGVHAQTLKAWLKEQLRGEEGSIKSLPLQLFGARPVTVAKVKLPKGN